MPEKMDEIVAFGMTRQVIIDAVNASSQENDQNDEDSSSYSEYVQSLKRGREALKKQGGYYPHLSRGSNS